MQKVIPFSNGSGKSVPNQYIVVDGKARYFQSYNSVIARIEGDKITLDRWYWDYSKTTSKYRNIFTGMDSKSTKASIASGEIKLVNLNG